MGASVVVLALLLAVGGAAGLAVYEVLVRSHAPALRVGARGEGAAVAGAGSRGRAASGTSGAKGTSEKDLAYGRFAQVIGRATRAIEHALPMARSDSEAYRELLSGAGWDIAPETWRGLRVLAAAAGALVACALTVPGGQLAPPAVCAFAAVAAVAGWALPRLVLARAEQRRRRAIERQLPDAMELLGIAVAAGSPVEQCFREVARNLEKPLSEEFEAVDREVNLLGHTREQAFEHLAKRCRSRDVAAFTAQLAQAVNQGSSVAEGLTAQAELARATAQAAAIERIRKMPTKLDIVLSFCFLPPTIALVVAPTVVNLMQFLNDTLQ
ncbi:MULTISPECIES: type II secretion system F family protein [Gordonibacter]|uniref:Type II secretion system F family protein n=1 Tax=Gordonibacter faecis TaxID=3047475 RepID=A0ABT7DL80_9ACTN|nr:MULTISPECIES: type II secretion system F family protein [unclassified Gordonibacter]MDJ1650284.1 type II secretion system F family protein [Gordonibacter sp. KGMB12511]HIW76870.1 type II secretion system F family protein [Candidatus Gordonibacter avicola]